MLQRGAEARLEVSPCFCGAVPFSTLHTRVPAILIFHLFHTFLWSGDRRAVVSHRDSILSLVLELNMYLFPFEQYLPLPLSGSIDSNGSLARPVLGARCELDSTVEE